MQQCEAQARGLQSVDARTRRGLQLRVTTSTRTETRQVGQEGMKVSDSHTRLVKERTDESIQEDVVREGRSRVTCFLSFLQVRPSEDGSSRVPEVRSLHPGSTDKRRLGDGCRPCTEKYSFRSSIASRRASNPKDMCGGQPQDSDYGVLKCLVQVDIRRPIICKFLLFNGSSPH